MALKTITLERQNPQLQCDGGDLQIGGLVDITLKTGKFPEATLPISSTLQAIGPSGAGYDYTYDLQYESNDLPSGVLEIDPCDVEMIQCGGLCSPLTLEDVCETPGTIAEESCNALKPQDSCPAINPVGMCDQDVIDCNLPELPCSPSYAELVEHVRLLRAKLVEICNTKSIAFLQTFEVRLREATAKGAQNANLIDNLESEIIKLKNQ